MGEDRRDGRGRKGKERWDGRGWEGVEEEMGGGEDKQMQQDDQVCVCCLGEAKLRLQSLFFFLDVVAYPLTFSKLALLTHHPTLTIYRYITSTCAWGGTT